MFKFKIKRKEKKNINNCEKKQHIQQISRLLTQQMSYDALIQKATRN